MTDDDGFFIFLAGILVGMLLIGVLLWASGPECQTVTPGPNAEYAARGGQPGGYWVEGGEIAAFGYDENDTPKKLSCFPELED